MTIHAIAEALQPRVEDLCRQLLPGGTKQGHEWKAGDVTGAPGDSLTVELNGSKAGLWCDQATSEGGDIIDLIAAAKVLSVGKAAKWAREWLGLPDDIPNGAASANGHFDPLKVGFKRQDETVWRNGSAAWTYHDADGKPIGWVVRFDRPGGGKDILPLRMIDGKPKWKGWKNPEPKPLYNLHLLTRRPDAPILIVEGEKTADAAAKLFPQSVVMTWAAGAKNVSSVDWSPVVAAVASGRPIRLWPDADKPGREAMLYLKARFPTALVVRTEDLPDGWDLADPVPAGISVQGLYDAAGQAEAEPAKTEPQPEPFRLLGHDEQGFYYYLSFSSGNVVRLKAPEHTDMNLQRIAPDSYWIAKGFINERTPGVDYKSVWKHLRVVQDATGHFNPDRVRGRGCWLETNSTGETDIIYHAGDRLYVNGVERSLRDHRSKFIYLSGDAITVNLAVLATTQDCAKVVAVANLLPWAPGAMQWVMPALAFIAPICGALEWRPHGWLTGGQGVGKSWTYRNFFALLIGDGLVKALSSTTSAGLRQKLRCDAFPVIFDEIDSDDDTGRGRIRAILELVRQSSSETGGSIYHGTIGGNAISYRIRSTFIFSSLSSGTLNPADEARIAMMKYLKNKSPDSAARFEELTAIWNDSIRRPEFCQAFQARAISMAKLIRKAASVMQSAITKVCSDARKGDQYGTLAAGYWLMTSDSVPTIEEAIAWAQEQDWSILGAGDDKDADSTRVTDVISQHRTSYEDPDGKRHEASVAELMAIYYKNDLRRDNIHDALMRLGIHMMHDSVDLPVRHTELARIFRETPYAGRWKDHLLEFSGSHPILYKLFGKKMTRGIRVPLKFFLVDDQMDLAEPVSG